MNNQYWTREERDRHQAEFDRYDGGSMIVPCIDEMRRILATVEAQREATRALLELIDTDDRLDDRCLGCNVDAGECREGCEVEKARSLLAALDGEAVGSVRSTVEGKP